MTHITIEREALQTVLEALESCDQIYGSEGSYQYFSQAMVDKAITVAKQALAAPVQEPVAALDRIKEALPEFRQQDDYLLAHGASLLSEHSHEIIHIDTALRIAEATQPATPVPLEDQRKLPENAARLIIEAWIKETYGDGYSYILGVVD
jgi:hypothetical protein